MVFNAEGRGTHTHLQRSDLAGYLSDESDFYGPPSMQQEYQTRADGFSTSKYWSSRRLCFNALAARNLATDAKLQPEVPSVVLYNPYEGNVWGRQLHETPEQFLDRLPPESTSVFTLGDPWIFVANPFLGKKDDSDARSQNGIGGTVGAVRQGLAILQSFSHQQEAIERNSLLSKADMNRAIGVARDDVEARIQDLALRANITTGKWMLFVSGAAVNDVWKLVVKHTIQNDLGTGAKVAPYINDSKETRLICIYTKDFSAKHDVKRVLLQLKSVGLVQAKGRSIYYKCDMYTHLDLKAKNAFGIRPWLYDSASFLKADEDPATPDAGEASAKGPAKKKRKL